ncbi:CoA-disulfide reductase [Brevibacillus sp. SYP-B805]|uniref:CoA-disulfide reductase n=1 Tax=Brevibacillus sp. SYP-B805 TaxID=1578199 RepID=UPI0013ED9D3C|nr:CoA-disulfide reductase [Brevibacillus sp. SYP-B805]NGQ95923.1 CoA-disulfide reductase [Brevibacillus sp. SYP-B805]
MSRKIVIVGGVAGGATAAARLRRLNEHDHIILFERGEHISFANCGLPYYIGEKITQRQKLLVQTVEGMSARFHLDIRNLSEVIRINRDRQTVSVRDLRSGEIYEEGYDILILSPGAKPIKPPLSGIEEAEALFTLRNIPDTDAIKEYVDSRRPGHAVVIGGGFIGVEMAENLRERGLGVTLVEMADQVLPPLDLEMAALVHDHLRSKGVELILADGVQALADKGKRVKLASGREIATDMIILAIGVQPESNLAKEAGLELGVRGTIRVNESLQTSDPSIYAIGDAIEVKDWINGQPTMVPLAWGANRQGRLVADHINGRRAAYKGALGTAIVKVFDLTVAITGNNEKTLKKLGMPYEAIHIHPASHAGYYPGAAQLSLKLLFEPKTGRILGAQAVSAEGADKRIDVIATAIKGGLTVFDLADLELAYAPPYSSAKDPVNLAGYVASNIAEGLVEIVQWHEIDRLVADGGLLIDVREPVEREKGYIPGSINIPLGELRSRLADIPKDRTVYVSCQVGLRGYIAARILSQHGFRVKNVDGGYKTYASVYGEGRTEPRSDSREE